MSLKDLMIPQEKVFFELFELQAEIAVEAATQLVDIFSDYRDIEAKYHVLKEIEHRGDEATHRAHDELNQTFITPFEPEEISRLVNTLDDIVDFMDEGARFLVIYNIDKPDPHLLDIAKCLLDATKEIQKGVKHLRTLKDVNALQESIKEINRLENVADELETKALRSLFSTNDPLYIMKMKDIYEHLEASADKCEDLADVMTGILIRHT
ncbi:MAG TPA: DUF47 family protein [Methanocorpusculum sp.]|nr:DUF47 family protein [Methanocorpusculum sp.]